MASRRAVPTPAPDKNSWWESISEKVIVAVVTAIATGLLALVGPPLKDWMYSAFNDTRGTSEAETNFQQSKWLANPKCAIAQPLWHEADSGRQIDATICPRTGDILAVMRDTNGRQFQWWPNVQGLTRLFDVTTASAAQNFVVPAAMAQEISRQPLPTPPAQRAIAQNVLCQLLLPDRRGLRRRIIVGPNQCVEEVIDTYTGMLVSRRPIPCLPNCAVNA